MKNFFKHTFLFKDIDEKDLNGLISIIDPQTLHFERGDVIYTPNTFESKIGFVIGGECEVRKIHHDSPCVRLNTLKKYNSFGILSIFSDKAEYPSHIYATKKCTVCFIKADDMKKLIETDNRVALNLISFLTRKIEFLNDKISTFSSTSVEKKLSNFLLAEFKKNGAFEFQLNKKYTAEAIGAGRASLYRAISTLEAQELIEINDKKIIIKDITGLERISK